jgi:hypothetical protein
MWDTDPEKTIPRHESETPVERRLSAYPKVAALPRSVVPEDFSRSVLSDLMLQ